jgi:hypothetical protein
MLINEKAMKAIGRNIASDVETIAEEIATAVDDDDCMLLLSYVEIAQRNLNRLKDCLRAELEEREFNDI